MTDAATDPSRRKPRIALMGEFSAGKSTLTNLLIGEHKIPMKVTATQLPPVWLSWGDDDPYRESLDGTRHPIDSLDDIPLRETAFIRLFMKAEVLEAADIIDTPGISDPNMSPEIWQRAANEADGVLWLTHATQAWRQSEAAVWDSLPDELHGRSLLLLTRIDKILTETDRARVLTRVKRETEGLFRAVLPVSLTQALAAGDDEDQWIRSGAADFSEALLDVIGEVQAELIRSGATHDRKFQPVITPVDEEEQTDVEPAAAAPATAEAQATAAAQRVKLRVVSTEPAPAQMAAAPRRVVRRSDFATDRPERPARPAS